MSAFCVFARACACAWLRVCVYVRFAAARAKFAFGATGRARALAAGVTWTSRTLKAEWAGRYSHTSVVDAAGAIYVIGGVGGGTNFHDVWASTDRGARAGLGQGVGGSQGVLAEYSAVLQWYHRGT